MYTFLLTLLVIDSIVLGAAVLLQAGRGGGLAASFGGASSSPDAFVGTRQAANLLTRTTWWSAGVFMALAYALALMGTSSAAPRSVLDKPFSQQQAPVAPSAPSPQSSQQAVPLQPAAPSATPVVPLQPAAPAPAPASAPSSKPSKP